MILDAKMNHLACTLLVLCTASAVTAAAPTEATLQHQFAAHVGPFLKSYCLNCHGKELSEAKLDLSVYTSAQSVTNAHRTWEIVLERIDAGEMPPKDSPRQPTPIQRQAFIDWIHAAREFEINNHAGDPGPVLPRRLSNAEYNYTIRDLTGVDIRPTKTFPIDPANEAGFDNSGESLSMTPALARKYLDAARQVIEHLILKPDGFDFAPFPVITDTDRDKYCVQRIIQFYERQPTHLADYFLAAWTYQQRSTSQETLNDVATDQGVSAKYLSTLWTLLTDETSSIGPIAMLQAMWRELPQDPDQVAAARDACHAMAERVAEIHSRLARTYPNLNIQDSNPGSQPFVLWKNRQYAANRQTFHREALQAQPEEPTNPDTANLSSLDRLLQLPSSNQDREAHDAAFVRFCSVFPDAFYISERGRDYVAEEDKPEGDKGRLLSAGFHSMMGYFRDDAPLYHLILNPSQQRQLDALWHQLNFVAAAPLRQYTGFLWFERTDSIFMQDAQFDFARPENAQSLSQSMIDKLSVAYIEKAIQKKAGPVEIEALQHYFRTINEQIRQVEQARVAAEPTHLKSVLTFAVRAFRRPLLTAEQEELVSFYHSRKEDESLSHEEAIQDTIVSILMSPQFCYRLDLAGVGEGQRALTDFELASRLSYFLWSSTPDAPLMDKASSGELHHPDVLVAQTNRMMKHQRARGFATEFCGNWLDFRRFEVHNAVDRERFPSFNDDLRQSMFEEPIRFFIDVLQEDRSVFSFLDADHTFVNAALARHYNLPAESASHDNWVRIDNVSQVDRGGVLPMAVFLTKNAPGLRTSPVKRGYWVVRRLLGERIPPPPPNVPELPDDESQLGNLTLGETLARHRNHKNCAGCHDRFDSLGLVFEGFGPIGERREHDLGGRPVSTTATLPGGHEATGIGGLQTYLRKHRQDEYLDNLCRKLLSYSLGRTLILSDELLLRDMRANLAAEHFRFGSLVETIVTSPQFLNKRGGDYLFQQTSSRTH